MRKLLALVVLLALAAPAFGADNTLLVTPCAAGCITTKSKDIGAGVQAPQPIISDTAGNPIYGTSTAPNANTITAVPVLGTATLTGWTTATALNTTQVLMGSNAGAPSILVQLNQTSTLTVGAVTFEGTYDGTNWVTIPVAQILNPNTLASLTNPYTLVVSTNQPFLILTQGYQSVRIRLSTQITGTATVTPFVTLLPYNPTVSALLNPLVAGGAIIGQVGINQTTFGTTNGVVSAANTYNTVAASQTAQAMTGGGGGASSDYLSHCVVTPGTTSPGVVTVLDNATPIISFAGGASSVSNLVPFALPVGAKSTSGAWKITTGANVTVVCVGKFS